MFTKENFEDLLECQSLLNMLREEEKNIEGQNQRIALLEQKNQENEQGAQELKDQINSLKKIVVKNEKNLFEIDHKLEQLLKNENMIKDSQQAESYKKEDTHLRELKDQLEIEILEKLDQIEKDEKKTSEFEEFRLNFPKSRNIINEEAEAAKTESEKKISSYKSRIKKILDELPENMAAIFRSQVKKFHKGQLFARLISKNCSICKFSIPQNQQDQVNKLIALEFCSSCRRLLIPN